MPVASLALALVLTASSVNPEEWVHQLGSPRYADREAAAVALEKLGRVALPALRVGKLSTDMEVRSRSERLLARIEGSLLLNPTLVTLDFDNQPINATLNAINERSDLHLKLPPELESRPDVGGRRINLRSPEPVPFWTALDMLCDASGLTYTLEQRGPMGVRDGSLPLGMGTTRPPGMISDHGPFRVSLLSLHFQRDLTFGIPGNIPQPNGLGGAPVQGGTANGQVTQEQFFVRINVAVEPSLSAVQAGSVKVTAASDDRGTSLLLPQDVNTNQVMGYFGQSSGPVNYQVSLKHPALPSRSIRLLRGTVPLLVSARKADPMVIPIAASLGKPQANSDATITLHELKPNPNTNQQTLELTIIPKVDPNAANIEVEGTALMAMRQDVSPLQLEVLDGSGKPMNWYLSGSNQVGEDVRLILTVLPAPGGSVAPPASIRYYSTVRAKADVPFEFHDVPMP